MKHADAVVAGEAEDVWPEVLADFAEGRTRASTARPAGGIARAACRAIDYETLPLLKCDAFKRQRALPHVLPLAGRVLARLSRTPASTAPCRRTTSARSAPGRSTTSSRISSRIKALGGNRILFLDDNPIAHPNDAKELFRAMIPLGSSGRRSRTINIARDPELLDLAARSGCVSLSIGLESINEESLDAIRKDFNQAPRFRQDLAAIRAKGIQVIALIMVGLDGDTADTFGRTLQFLLDNKVSFLKLFTPCPYPGTKYYDDIAQAGPHPRTATGPATTTVARSSSPTEMTQRRDDGRLQVRLRRLLLDPRASPRRFSPADAAATWKRSRTWSPT